MSLSCWLSSPRGSSSGLFSDELSEKKQPFFLFLSELLHLSALLFVPQSSHSRSADVQVSLSSNAPSDWLRPPSDATLFFLLLPSSKRRFFFSLCQFYFQENLVVWLGDLAAVPHISLQGAVYGCGLLHCAISPHNTHRYTHIKSVRKKVSIRSLGLNQPALHYAFQKTKQKYKDP